MTEIKITIISFIRLFMMINVKCFFKIRSKNYPKVLQLPITSNCNSKCVMCNIWKDSHENEMSLNEIRKYFKDPIFKNVTAVGINGGEPSLVKNLPLMVEQIICLPSLKSLNIISNGFNKKLLVSKIAPIYNICKKKNINFHLSFSLDGYGDIHNSVRGVSKAFELTTKTIDHILSNQKDYCDFVDIGCTVVKQNVDNLIEIDTYATMNNYSMKYRLGVENKRIKSKETALEYSVLYDQRSRQSVNQLRNSCTADIINQKITVISSNISLFSRFYPQTILKGF